VSGTHWTIQFPDVASTWHLSRNGSFTAGAAEWPWPDWVWWRCPAGHE
jgi:hypothetical protein